MGGNPLRRPPLTREHPLRATKQRSGGITQPVQPALSQGFVDVVRGTNAGSAFLSDFPGEPPGVIQKTGPVLGGQRHALALAPAAFLKVKFSLLHGDHLQNSLPQLPCHLALRPYFECRRFISGRLSAQM